MTETEIVAINARHHDVLHEIVETCLRHGSLLDVALIWSHPECGPHADLTRLVPAGNRRDLGADGFVFAAPRSVAEAILENYEVADPGALLGEPSMFVFPLLLLTLSRVSINRMTAVVYPITAPGGSA